MRYFLVFCLCFVLCRTVAQSRTDSLFRVLNVAIENRPQYTQEKRARIEELRKTVPRVPIQSQYQLYSLIYEDYKSFIYDSAFLYARKLQRVAARLHDPVKISHAKIKLGFVLVSAGLFNEALDTLQQIRTRTLPDTIKTEFFYLMARACFDLAVFSRDDFYRQIYTTRAFAYIDSALVLLPGQSADYLLMKGLRHMHLRDMAVAQQAYESLLARKHLSDQQFAIASSTLSFIYLNSGQEVKAKQMLLRAAIADIRSCTKETLATLNLADMLYKEGDVEKAYKYIKIAMEDATFYGARHREVQVAAIFPIIEGKQLSEVESKRKTLLLYSVALTLLTVVVIAFSIIVYRQFQKLTKADKIIQEANNKLTETNHQLMDANKIKEEYIWYYFNTMAEHINKLDALKKTLDMKVMTKKMDDIRYAVDSINIKREREELYHHFDEVFLKLFPDFVTVFNSLLKEEDRMVLKEGQLLNTELRIFALIRMGVHDHEKIAKILDYSVTTIYTYKTRLRNKSILPNEEFDRQIMNIRVI